MHNRVVQAQEGTQITLRRTIEQLKFSMTPLYIWRGGDGELQIKEGGVMEKTRSREVITQVTSLGVVHLSTDPCSFGLRTIGTTNHRVDSFFSSSYHEKHNLTDL